MFTLDDHERSSTHEQLREIHDDVGRFDEEVGRDHVEFLRSLGMEGVIREREREKVTVDGHQLMIMNIIIMCTSMIHC